MKLNEKQSLAMKEIIAGNNVFIDGPGGVGKSVLVREIKKHFEESTVFVAPTGIAALNIGGATIHSVFKFPFKVLTKSDHSRINEKTRELFDKDGPVKRIVIDEGPMVRADVFTCMDHQLRKIRRLNQPFGGLQVIFVGDFYQLPPVVTNSEKRDFYNEGFESPFCFSSDSWSSADFKHIELDQIMRQSDEQMISNLMKIRRKSEGWEDSVEFFNKVGMRNREAVLDEDPVFLCSTNAAANSINEYNYQELEDEERVFYAKRTGKFQSEPSPYELCLKYGTKVIITANNDIHKNGQVGYVVGFIGDKIEVLLEENEEQILVERYTWEDVEYGISPTGGLTRNVMGRYIQYPLKHGWAITIHKAQGQTLTHAMIDLGNGSFAPGQTYVALSRLRSLDGLALSRKIKPSDVIVDDAINEFYENGCRGNGLLF